MSRLYISVGLAFFLWCMCAMLVSCSGSGSPAISTGNAGAGSDGIAVPSAIARSQVVKGGKAAMDSMNGSLRAKDGSFVFAASGLVSCDGWAFDDGRNSTPRGVWIELTQEATGRHYYWHAQRYERPALAAAERISSIVNAGFQCDPVGYSLPPGMYTAQVYQVDGQTAKVSNFTTYTPSPRITVK